MDNNRWSFGKRHFGKFSKFWIGCILRKANFFLRMLIEVRVEICGHMKFGSDFSKVDFSKSPTLTAFRLLDDFCKSRDLELFFLYP